MAVDAVDVRDQRRGDRPLTMILQALRRERPVALIWHAPLVSFARGIGDGSDDALPSVRFGAERIQTLSELDARFGDLLPVAGFEPDVHGTAHGHTLAAYRKPVE